MIANGWNYKNEKKLVRQWNSSWNIILLKHKYHGKENCIWLLLSATPWCSNYYFWQRNYFQQCSCINPTYIVKFIGIKKLQNKKLLGLRSCGFWKQQTKEFLEEPDWPWTNFKLSGTRGQHELSTIGLCIQRRQQWAFDTLASCLWALYC